MESLWLTPTYALQYLLTDTDNFWWKYRGMDTAPSLETTRVMIRDRSHSVKPGIENFAIMAGPESPLYRLVATATQPQQQGDLGRNKGEPAPKLIGWTGVVRVAPEEIGWYVTGPCRGLGVATEAVQAMLRRYWTAQPGTAELIAYIREGNVASERVATKAGLVRVLERTLVKGSTLPNGQVTGCDHGVWVAKKPT